MDFSHLFVLGPRRLRDASTATNSARHRLEILMSESLRGAYLRADSLNRFLEPAQLRSRFTEARVRFYSAYTGCTTAIERRRVAAEKRFGATLSGSRRPADALSPLAVLSRGYAIAQREDGTLLRDANSVSIGDSVQVRLAKGQIGVKVDQIEEA